jgi:hypothetical protein
MRVNDPGLGSTKLSKECAAGGKLAKKICSKPIDWSVAITEQYLRQWMVEGVLCAT